MRNRLCLHKSGGPFDRDTGSRRIAPITLQQLALVWQIHPDRELPLSTAVRACWRRRQAELGYDNALAETINGLYKAEVIWRQRSWPGASATKMAPLGWVDWFTNLRLLGPIGHIPSAEAGANYYAAEETLDMLA